MNFFNFIAWLTAGAVVGWFASRMVEAERTRQYEKLLLLEEARS